MKRHALKEAAPIFERWMQLRREHVASERPEEAELTRRTAAWCASGAAPWAQLPRAIQELYGPRGWRWNGFYALRGQDLMLGPAAGPPVCNHIEASPGPLKGGMCFDALLMNQTLHASEVKRWPAYISCDGESGLITKAGLVVPVRGAHGTPVAVFDLDATEPLLPGDPSFFDAFFATLSALLQPTAEDFLGPP